MRCSTLVLLLACPDCLGQRTWVVDMIGRAGTDFSDIPAAVAAAAPGDRVLVRSNGLYAYTSPTIDKPLDLVSINTHDPQRAFAVDLTGVLRVRSIPLGTAVRISGFSLMADISVPWGMEVSGCDGLCISRASTNPRSASTIPAMCFVIVATYGSIFANYGPIMFRYSSSVARHPRRAARCGRSAAPGSRLRPAGIRIRHRRSVWWTRR